MIDKVKRNRLMQYKYKILDEEFFKNIMLSIIEDDRSTHDANWVEKKPEEKKKKSTKNVIIEPEIKKVEKE